MPPKGEQPHGFDSLDRELETEALVGLLALGDFRVHGRRYNPSGHLFARCEGAVELDAEPAAELLGVADRAPYALARCAQQDSFLDTVCVCRHAQPPSCA